MTSYFFKKIIYLNFLTKGAALAAQISNKLRNGLFNFNALLHEVETKIKSLELSIYLFIYLFF